jgi:hypothetical protein
MGPDPPADDRERVEGAAGETDHATPGELTDEDPEPWLTRRQRRALQRVFSQALNRRAGTMRRRRHQRPPHYTGAREPVRLARARTIRATTEEP